ncbi:MAG: 2-C-methyl-D-erythritol 2,4-cyclodiphosphate synthase [Pseudomonadota bacterium]
MKIAAVIVAAGRGLRLGAPVPKQYLALAGRSVLARTVAVALSVPRIAAVQVAIGPDDGPLYGAALSGVDDPRLRPPIEGGKARVDTVRLALEALAGDAPDMVLIHDAARPFAPSALWSALIDAAAGGAGAIAAEPVVDALWRAGADAAADQPVPRAALWRAQTPQAFPYPEILAAHRADATADRPAALDDAEVFRRVGRDVQLVAGDPDNFKITTPDDFARAERLAAAQDRAARDRATESAMTDAPTAPPSAALPDIRTGHGFDVHRFGPGGSVWLCGVEIAHSHGLIGHSDADVGLHALADALYGALAEGDIGTHFPPADPQWKGAASHLFLAHAGARVAARGGRIANLDVTLLCERPKIGPHAAAMRARVGEILGLDPGRVSVKATTMERMGLIGREEGMGCIATATVVLPAAQT